MSLSRVPPHDLGAEMQLLGVLLAHPARRARVAVTCEHFYAVRLQELFAAIEALLEVGAVVDPVTVGAELERMGARSATRSTIAECLELDVGPPEPAFRILEELRRRRLALEAGHALVAAAEDRTVDLDDGLGGPFATLQAALGTAPVSLVDAATLSRARLPVLARPVQERRDAVTVGYRAVDSVGGLPRGELTILAGRPGMGKSALAQAFALNVARAGHRVLLATPEMSAASVADRLLAQLADVDLFALRRGKLSPPDWSDVERAAQMLPASLLVFDKGDMTSADVIATARGLALAGPLPLIIVDHLQYLADPKARMETRTEIVGRACKRLKALARQLDAAVVLLSQLNRENELRKSKRPALADLRDSGEIEQDADNVLLLHRPDYYEEADQPGLVELHIAKMRNGPTGLRKLWFEKSRTAFYDVRHDGSGPTQEPPQERLFA